jgi:hypothetical protein
VTVFRVTTRDIAQAPITGVCPVNAAMTRQLRRPVVVGHQIAAVGRRQLKLPGGVTARIQRWDTTGRMTPFQFSLEMGRR